MFDNNISQTITLLKNHLFDMRILKNISGKDKSVNLEFLFCKFPYVVQLNINAEPEKNRYYFIKKLPNKADYKT